MGLRRAAAYSKKYARPYTRKSKKKSKNYIKTVPPHKIVKMQMGDIKGFEKNRFKIILKLKSTEAVQVRDNALEACRLIVQKSLENEIPGQYYFALRVYPHHILRENKALTGAGADRMQTGMQKSFGTQIGRAAFVKPNQELFVVAINTDKARKSAREALTKVKPKLPCKSTISVEKNEA